VIRTFKDALSSLPSRIGYPWNTPTSKDITSASTSLFQEEITDQDRLHHYNRGIGGTIVDKIVDDALKPGFVVDRPGTAENPDKQLTRKAQSVFNRHHETLARAWKLARLYGYSFILLGFRDSRPLDSKHSWGEGKLDYTLAIPKPWVQSIQETDSLPGGIEHIEIITQSGAVKQIHSSRLIYIENRGLTPPPAGSTDRGQSVLDRPFDQLTVLEHHNWGGGQAVWRYGAGILIDIVPETDSPQEVVDAIGDPCAKTILAFPDGHQPSFIGPGGKALNPKPYFDQIITQLSGLTEYPRSILWGLSTGAVTGSELDRLNYADNTIAMQKRMTPSVRRLISEAIPIQDDQDKWEVHWNSPIITSTKEHLEEEKLRAEIDRIHVETGLRYTWELRERDGLDAKKGGKGEKIADEARP